MRKSKRGVTLVELIICCGIIVMVGAACTGVLLSGHNMFSGSANSANAQLDTDVVQAYLIHSLPRAANIDQISTSDSLPATGSFLYFDNDVFVIEIDGKKTTVRSVSDFTYKLSPAGPDTSTTARAQFQYTLTMSDGSKYSSGFILSNFSYASTIVTDLDEVGVVYRDGLSAKTYPICFSVPVPEEGVAPEYR